MIHIITPVLVYSCMHFNSTHVQILQPYCVIVYTIHVHVHVWYTQPEEILQPGQYHCVIVLTIHVHVPDCTYVMILQPGQYHCVID